MVTLKFQKTRTNDVVVYNIYLHFRQALSSISRHGQRGMHVWSEYGDRIEQEMKYGFEELTEEYQLSHESWLKKRAKPCHERLSRGDIRGPSLTPLDFGKRLIRSPACT